MDSGAHVGVEEAGGPFGEQSQLHHSIARVDAAIFSIAVRIEFARVDCSDQWSSARTCVHAKICGGVRAHLCQQIEIRRTGCTALGDDVYDPADCAASIAHRSTATYDLDALDLRHRNGGQSRSGQIDVVEAHTIDEDEHIARRARAHAADVYRGALVAAVKALQVEISLATQKVAHRSRV